MSDNVKYPPYTPMNSLGHELGILFGFLAACVLTVGVYYVLWNSKEESFSFAPFLNPLSKHHKKEKHAMPHLV
jgi:hypothetical protein